MLSSFGQSSTLLRNGVVCRLVAAFYPYKGDSDRQERDKTLGGYLFDK